MLIYHIIQIIIVYIYINNISKISHTENTHIYNILYTHSTPDLFSHCIYTYNNSDVIFTIILYHKIQILSIL